MNRDHYMMLYGEVNRDPAGRVHCLPRRPPLQAADPLRQLPPAARAVRRHLGLAQVEAEGALAEHDQRRRLDPLEVADPQLALHPLQVVEPVPGRREVVGEGSIPVAAAPAQLGEEPPLQQPLHQVGGMTAVLDQLTQHRVVIAVLDGVALSPGHVLVGRQLGAGHGGAVEQVPGDHLAAVDLGVEVLADLVDLHLVEVGDGGHRAGEVAVEGGVAEGHLGLVAVVGEQQPVPCGEAGEHVGAADAGLQVLVHEPGVVSGRAREDRLAHDPGDGAVELLDGHAQVVDTQAFRQAPGVVAGHRGVEAGRHVDCEDPFAAEGAFQETGDDAGVDAARQADEPAVGAAADVVEMSQSGEHGAVDRLHLPRRGRGRPHRDRGG